MNTPSNNPSAADNQQEIPSVEVISSVMQNWVQHWNESADQVRPHMEEVRANLRKLAGMYSAAPENFLAAADQVLSPDQGQHLVLILPNESQK